MVSPAIINALLLERVEEALASTSGASSISELDVPLLQSSAREIDHYGQMLVGCLNCNRWGHPGDDKLVMELLPDDLEALRAMLSDFE
jgi:hypothetical protein